MSLYLGFTVSSTVGASVGFLVDLVGLALVGLLDGLGCIGRRVEGFLDGLELSSAATSIDRSSFVKKSLVTGAEKSVTER